MKQKVNPKREGFHTLTTYLIVDGVEKLINFIQEAFEGEVKAKFDRNDGTVMHAEMKIGDSMLMMGEPTDEFEPINASLYLYVEDCDAVFKKALDAGATPVMQPTTMHHAGERYGGVKDITGNIWWIATHVEDISTEEERKRIKAMGKTS